MSDFILRLYEADDTTVHFEVGTAADHANPYLHTPELFAESEIDLLEGTARIGRINLRVADPQTGATQVDRFLTARLGLTLGGTEGYSAINGRRAALLHSPSGRVVLDGVAAGVSLTESYAGFTIALEDIRARGIDFSLFSRSGSSTVFPRGTLNGFGALPGGGWLVPPTTPARGRFNMADNGTSGTVAFVNSSGVGGLDHAKRSGHFLTPAVIRAMTPEWSARAGANVLRNVSVWWRNVSGDTSWKKLEDMPVRGIVYEGHHNPVGPIGTYFEADASGTKLIFGLDIFATSSVGVPADQALIDLMVVYTGPPSEDYPLHYEGTAGALLKQVLDGVYSTDENGGPVDPRIRYDASRFVGPTALPALNTAIRFRITEPHDDLREWFEEACKALGIAPALDHLGRIAPVGQQIPDATVTLAELTDTNCVAIPAWEHSTSGAITQLDIEYPRYYKVAPADDPSGQRSAGDGIATIVQKLSVRPQDATIQQVMGVKPFEVDGFLFAALGAAEGEPISGDVTDETGAQIAYSRGHELIDRFAFGGQSDFVKAARTDPAVEALKVGDWVIDGRSWAPNYATGKRGRNHLSQVVSIRDLNSAWREMRIVDAAPYANPIGQPTLGTVTASVDGIVSVPVVTVPTGGEARVEYAISDTLPGATSALWTFLGRTAVASTLTSPAIPAGRTVWIRARGEKEGRRPSAWTNAVSVTLTQLPRVLSARVSIDSSGVPTVEWSVNGYAPGVRIYYAVHTTGTASGTLSTYSSFSAAAGLGVLPTIVSPGQQITVEVEPWTGWTGSAVSGTAGARLRREAAVPGRAAVVVQYASDDIGTSSSGTFDPDVHAFMRISENGGLTYTAWFRIVGENGASTEGKYVDFRFKVAAIQPATPTGAIPVGWSDAPPAYDPNTGNKLWMSRAWKDSLDDSLIGTWSVPVQVTGATGPQGDPGEMLLDIEFRGSASGIRTYELVKLSAGYTADVYWKVFDVSATNGALPAGWLAQLLQDVNLKAVLIDVGEEFTAQEPPVNTILRGVVLARSTTPNGANEFPVAGDGWEFGADGSEPIIRASEPTFTEASDGLSSVMSLRVQDPRSVVSGVDLFFIEAGVETGPFGMLLASGTYSFPFALHPLHPITIRVRINRNDGGDAVWLGPFTADTDKTPGIPQARDGSRVGDLVTVLVDADDTDTASLHFREDVGGVLGAENNIPARGSDPRFGAFTVTAHPTNDRTFRIYGKNSAGVIGEYRLLVVGPPVDVSQIAEVEAALSDLETTINTSFRDGVINAAEAKAIAEHTRGLVTEKADVNQEYVSVYTNPDLIGLPAEHLYGAKQSYDIAHGALLSAIAAAIIDGGITPTERTNVSDAFAAYRTALQAYRQRLEEAREAIQTKKTDDGVDDAKNYADSILIAGDGSAIIRATEPPTTRPGGSSLKVGDMWIDTDNGSNVSSWTGTAWGEAMTQIDGGRIKTGTAIIGVIYSGEIETITFKATGTMSSGASYVPGVSGWRIKGNGDAEFNQVVVRGIIYATGGEFTGKVRVIKGTGYLVEFLDTDGITQLGSLLPMVGDKGLSIFGWDKLSLYSSHGMSFQGGAVTWHVDNVFGEMSTGPNNSAGAGYRVMRVPNT